MCLIVDANVAANFFLTNDARFVPLKEAVFKGKCCVYYGGHLTTEYSRLSDVIRIIAVLDRAGKAQVFADRAIQAEADTLIESGVMVSNDAHVLALARVSGSRLLCSRDQNLHTDFTNPQLLNSPRGKVYQDSSHSHLIRTHCGTC